MEKENHIYFVYVVSNIIWNINWQILHFFELQMFKEDMNELQ